MLVPAYNASGGDPVIFYGVTAGILAGAVAGDHASPISDTTILSAMASECQILNHVKTQAPYAIMVAIWSVLVGTIPSGRGAFPNWVSILLGFIFMLFHAVFTSEFAINKTGRYDIFTELYLRCTRDKEFLLKLKEDTVAAYESGEPISLKDSKLVQDEATTKPAKELSDRSDVSANPEQGVEVDDIENQMAEKDTENQDMEEANEQALEVEALPAEEPIIEEHEGKSQ